jgi:hypothetical protein
MGHYYFSTIQIALLIFASAGITEAFTSLGRIEARKSMLQSSLVTRNSQSDDEIAARMTEYLSKAHEDKIRAIADVEAKYKTKIEELEAKIKDLESASQSSENTYTFPATNKDLTEKIRSYQAFISGYIVRAQQDKLLAVRAAEEKLKAKYETSKASAGASQ